MAGEIAEPFQVLLPILWGQRAAPLLSLADALGEAGGGRVLGLVEDTGSNSVGDPAQRRLGFLRWLAGEDYDVSSLARAMPLEVRLTQDPARSVIEAAAESRANLIVTEWPGGADARRQRVRRLLASLIGQTRLSLAMVRLAPEDVGRTVVPRSVLIPVRSGPNAKLAIRIGTALGGLTGAKTTLLHVQDRRQHPDRIEREERAFQSLAETAAAGPGHSVLEVSSNDPTGTLLEIAAGFDLVVMGTRLAAQAPSQLLAAAMSRLMPALRATVILARSSESPAWAAGRGTG